MVMRALLRVAAVAMFEIQSSQLALAKQADADTKPFEEKNGPGPSEDIKRIEGQERQGFRRQLRPDPAQGAPRCGRAVRGLRQGRRQCRNCRAGRWLGAT